MNVKYFNRTFELGKNDCWTLLQEVYYDKHGVKLPDFPFVVEDEDRAYKEFKTNIDLEQVQKASKGCIIVFKSGKDTFHCGYALNSKDYFHMTRKGATTTAIPKKAEIYKVLDVL